MRWDRQALLLAYIFASPSAHGLAIQQHAIASSTSHPANLVAHEPRSFQIDAAAGSVHISDDESPLHKPPFAAIIRERAWKEERRADSASASSPGLIVPGFHLPSGSGQPSLVAVPTTIPSASATPSATMSSVNALSVLVSALPSSARQSLESAASSIVSQVLHSESQQATIHASTTSASQISSTRTTASTSKQTSQSPTTCQTTTSHTPTTLHTSTSPHTSTSTPFTPSANPAHQISPTPTPGSDPAHPIANAAVAGIASGLGAAAVLALFTAFYIWRRKRANQPIFSRMHNSQRSGASDGIYPKSAWLYDPVMTPVASRSRAQSIASVADSQAGSEAEQNLLPNPARDSRPLSEDIEADLGLPSPSLRAADRSSGASGNRASSPLLPQAIPAITISGHEDVDGGPYGGGEGSAWLGGRMSR